MAEFDKSAYEDIGPFLLGDRPMPQSQEAEKAVLSCMLQDAENAVDSALGILKTEEVFILPAHQRIFATICEMRQEMQMRPELIDLVTVIDQLTRTDKLEIVGGIDYLNHLHNILPTTANVEIYCDKVLESFMLRRLIASCSEIVKESYNATDVTAIIDKAESSILRVTELRSNMNIAGIKELIKSAVQYLEDLSKQEKGALGVATGYMDLDRLITGMKPGDMIVLAARPSIGKTTLAMNIARNVALNKENPVPVGVFSLEMSSEQVAVRMLCSEAKLNLKDLRDGRLTNSKWRSDLLPAADKLFKAPIHIDDTPQISSLELRQKARRLYHDHGVRFLVIDYLQLMKATGGNSQTSREQEVAKLSGEIKGLAKELQIPVMILAQLNRQAEQGGQRPKISQLRESGAIEQDADMVFLLHRERETESGVTREEILQGLESELIVAKNRNGETGIVKLLFFPHFTQFENKSRIDDADVPAESI